MASVVRRPMRPLATAMRCVAALVAISTMWSGPGRQKWVSADIGKLFGWRKASYEDAKQSLPEEPKMSIRCYHQVPRKMLCNVFRLGRAIFVSDGGRDGLSAKLSPPFPTSATPATHHQRRAPSGDRIIREAVPDPDYVDDPVVADYAGIGSLLSAAKSRGELSAELDERFAWEMLLGRDRTVNAFAPARRVPGVHLV